MAYARYVSPSLKAELSRRTREINLGSIDEDTVRGLFAQLREHSAQKSLTLEIGDFFAHPERDRGITRSLIEPTFQAIVEHFRDKAPLPRIVPVGYLDIVTDLNKHLGLLGIEEIREHAHLDAALTLFLALQGSRVALSKELVLPLSVAVRGEDISIACHCGTFNEKAVVFPVFTMPNYGAFAEFVHPDPYDERWPLYRSRRVNGRRELYFEGVPLIVDFGKAKR